MLTNPLILKRTLAGAALLSIALAVPISVAGADPATEVDADRKASESARPTPATVTVTAMVAPGQCKPIAGGPSPVAVTDTAHETAEPTPVATGAASSRFDPYTCELVSPAESITSPGATPTAVPSYTPSLNPYPGQSSGGVGQSSDPLSAPSTSVTIPPAPAATTTVPAATPVR